jgi:hypothetical protein
VVSVLVTAIALGGAAYLYRRNLARYWISISLSIVLVLIFTMAAVLPILDTHKSFVPFSRQVMASVPEDKALYAYQPDETLRGAIPFYTGRFVIETEEIGKDLLSKEEPFYLMIRDKKEAMEKELLSTGRFHILVKQMMGSDRALVLFSNRPALNTTKIGDGFEKVTLPKVQP